MSMSEELKLTPVELFFCGKLLQAKYIDYDYFAAMPDIQINHDLREQEALEKLEEDGVVEMDFYDNAEFEEEAKELLLPVFFGETESRMEIKDGPVFRFHIYHGKIVMTTLENNEITLQEITGDTQLDALFERVKTGEIVISCANVHTGQKNGFFTKEQLMDSGSRKLAISLLKGEA